MIYALINTVMTPGKVTEAQEIWIKEAMPLVPKVGLKVVGAWHGSTGNVNESYVILAYNDMAAFQKSREAIRQNADWRKVTAKLDALRVSQTTTILEPAAWSPMQ